LAQSAKARAVLEEENERLNTRLAEVSMWTLACSLDLV
jgi:hypothetical protein